MQLPIQNAHGAPSRPSKKKQHQLAASVTRGMLGIGLAIFIVSTVYIYVVLGDHSILALQRLQFMAPICMLVGGLWGLHSWYTAGKG